MSQKVDVWMPLFIGDYLADTGHLTTEEHGAYLLLMFHYWRRGPLPNDAKRLAAIVGLRKDAWSRAWGALEQFFTLDEAAGLLRHKRIDLELSAAGERRLKNKNRAEKAASARWGTSDATSNATSIGQALHKECPSPSPSPSHSKKPSGKPEADPRHALFHEQIDRYWKHKTGEDKSPWDGSEGKALSLLLAAKPDLTVEKFRVLLKHRGDSPAELQTERPRVWLPNILRFADGPLDRYGKLLNPVQPKPARRYANEVPA